MSLCAGWHITTLFRSECRYVQKKKKTIVLLLSSGRKAPIQLVEKSKCPSLAYTGTPAHSFSYYEDFSYLHMGGIGIFSMIALYRSEWPISQKEKYALSININNIDQTIIVIIAI